MAAERLSRLQRRILRYVYEVETRSRGMVSSSCALWGGTRAMSASVCGTWKPRALSRYLGRVGAKLKPLHSHGRAKIERLF